MTSPAGNAALMERYYDEVFNRRNLAFLREHVHADLVAAVHKPTGKPVRCCGLRAAERGDAGAGCRTAPSFDI